MTLPQPPDLARPRWRLLAAAAVVTLLTGIVLGFQEWRNLPVAYGDTDDAMRLVLVRELLNGQGWWSQHLMRVQPPVGVYMHWSRLLDGALAAMESVLRLFAPTSAERLTRLLWPLLCIFPAALATLILSDRLSERRAGRTPGAVLICAIFLVTNAVLYIQFHVGRVDHHNVQMALCFLALAGAAQRGPGIKGALLAGTATGLGLAIGLEALLFEAVIGAALALRFVFDPRDARPLRAYGLALAATTLAAFCIQTPPWRWTTAACDALAFNSVAAVVTAGLAVAAASYTSARGVWVRFAALASGAIATAAVYVLLDKSCLRGPFADVDPAIKSFWLVHVKEMKPWPALATTQPNDAIVLAAGPIIGLLGLLWLGRRREVRSDGAFRMTAGVFLLMIGAGLSGVRMCGYADWVAMAIVAAAAADLADVGVRRFGRERLIAVLVAALVLEPNNYAVAAQWIDHAVTHGLGGAGKKGAVAKKEDETRPAFDHCVQIAPYRALNALTPSGLVLSEIDLGPFVLAGSQDSILAAPYHRMSWGMIAARGALSADADHGAEAKTRALGVTYVLECRTHSNHSDRLGMGANSLQKRLDRGQPPSWLVQASKPDAPLTIYTLKPAGPLAVSP